MARTKAQPVAPSDRIAAILKKVDGVKRGSDTLLSDTEYYISTQLAYVDYIIGRPGIPSGKLTTVFGREASGKSTLVYHLLAETQARGGIAVLVDTEQRFPKGRAHLIGINEADIIIIEGLTLEASFEKIEELVDTIKKDFPGVPVTFVFDSIAGAVPEKRMEKELTDVIMAPAAKFVSAVLGRLKLKMAGADMALVCVNQLRSRIGGLDPSNPSTYERIKVMGKSQTMIAEWPLIFESALMLYVHSVSNTGKDKAAPTGLRSRVVNRKCGIAPREMWRCEIDIDYRTGGDKLGSKFDLLLALGYIKKASANGRFVVAGYEDEPSFQRAGFAATFAKHPELDILVAEAPTLWTTLNDEEDDHVNELLDMGSLDDDDPEEV